MDRSFPAWAAALVVVALLGRTSTQEDGQEPVQRFFLEVGDEQIPIHANRPFELTLGEATHRAVLRPDPTRTFLLADFEFEYPSFMAFEANLEATGIDLWTLDGNSCVIQVVHYEGLIGTEDALAETVSSTLEALGNPAVDSRDDPLMLGGATWNGRRLWVRFGDIPMEYAFYAHSNEDGVYVLSLLDTLDDEGKRTQEAARCMRLLQSTFRSL